MKFHKFIYLFYKINKFSAKFESRSGQSIFESDASHHQHQKFVMTKSEVIDVVSVLNFISEYLKDNRISTKKFLNNHQAHSAASSENVEILLKKKEKQLRNHFFKVTFAT